jgi:hypothetical protein
LALVVDGRFEEVDDIFMLDVLRAIARDVKRAEASSMLGELVSPQDVVGTGLGDPVLVHPREEIIAAKGLDEGVDTGTVVGRHDGAVGKAVCGVWSGDWVVLAREIAVLGVGAVAGIALDMFSDRRRTPRDTKSQATIHAA